ncbi:hypothetical protein BBJ28_00019969 [Nothophytophthora sp. Chile5]|nr:hypothetical protein BBJ28_00019969 [Nothophytophthora sp. Chile5]
MLPRSLAVLLVLTAICAASTNVLSTECGGVCGVYETCVTFTSLESCSFCLTAEIDGCAYDCVSTTLYTSTATFDSYQSYEEVAGRAAKVREANANYAAYYARSNDKVISVGKLQVRPAIDARISAMAGGNIAGNFLYLK